MLDWRGYLCRLAALSSVNLTVLLYKNTVCSEVYYASQKMSHTTFSAVENLYLTRTELSVTSAGHMEVPAELICIHPCISTSPSG